MNCFTCKTLLGTNWVRIHLLRVKPIVLRVKPFVLRVKQKYYYNNNNLFQTIVHMDKKK